MVILLKIYWIINHFSLIDILLIYNLGHNVFGTGGDYIGKQWFMDSASLSKDQGICGYITI